MAEVAFHEVTKVFPGGTTAVEHLTLRVEDGEFLVLVGPSGCGKTTALRMVAGLDEPTSGAVVIGDTIVNGVPPQDRDVAMVFQNYALYPHQTVRQNLAFGLQQRKVSRDVIASGSNRSALCSRSTSSSTASRLSSRVDSVSGWPWGARWLEARRSFCWTSRCRTWMHSCARSCARS